MICLYISGSWVNVGREQLAFRDSEDSDADIEITLANDTTHGHLEVNGQSDKVKKGDHFTQEDINKERVRYKHH